jgi:hypothetical protein
VRRAISITVRLPSSAECVKVNESALTFWRKRTPDRRATHGAQYSQLVKPASSPCMPRVSEISPP